MLPHLRCPLSHKSHRLFSTCRLLADEVGSTPNLVSDGFTKPSERSQYPPGFIHFDLLDKKGPLRPRLDRLKAPQLRAVKRHRDNLLDNIHVVSAKIAIARDENQPLPSPDLSQSLGRCKQLLSTLDHQINILHDLCRTRGEFSNVELEARWRRANFFWKTKFRHETQKRSGRSAVLESLKDRQRRLIQELDAAQSLLPRAERERTDDLISVAPIVKQRRGPDPMKRQRSAPGAGISDQVDAQKRMKKERKAVPTLAECGNGDLLDIEARELLSTPRKQVEASNGQVKDVVIEDAAPRKKQPPVWRDRELDIEALSSTGDALARHPSLEHVYVIPFAMPGDRVKLRGIEPRSDSPIWSKADFVEVVRPSDLRNDTTPQCKYFAQCGGCQFQMISYEEQLKRKKTVVEKAYRFFSGLDASHLPTIGETGASPLQYGYRTKLTPHFDAPPKGTRYSSDNLPAIGFTRKNMPKIIDIESCPISTDIIQRGLHSERRKIKEKISDYKRGATILLRETTRRSYGEKTEGSNGAETTSTPLPKSALELPGLELQPESPSAPKHGPIQNTYLYRDPSQPTDHPPSKIYETKRWTTDENAYATEYIGNYEFRTRAGSFFQNNNSILPSFLSYVREKILPTQTDPSAPPIKYLLDAYCGSGLFALTLSPLFKSVLGIELDPWSVSSARQNAQLNNITNCGFIEADAAALFQDVPYPADQTVLVIDPPRKGCSTDFLRQLLRYGPTRVVYVSCNVGSQARDVGCLVRGSVGWDWWKDGGGDVGEEDGEKREVGRYKYVVEELRGFDFFPQTGHVEGLCVLRRVKNEEFEEGEVAEAGNK